MRCNLTNPAKVLGSNPEGRSSRRTFSHWSGEIVRLDACPDGAAPLGHRPSCTFRQKSKNITLSSK
eukprot:7182818-Prymnesium_polylepis.1